MRLNLTPIPSNVFSYRRESGLVHMTAEISDFGPGFRFQLLYDDAMDVGMAVQSTKTDAVVHYYLSDTIESREGETDAWILVPTTESIRQHPSCENTRITLFND